MKNQSSHRRIWEPLLVGIAAAIGLLAGYNMQNDGDRSPLIQIYNADDDQVHNDGRIEEILRFIETNYVDSLDEEAIAVDAIRHILKQLDPHSDYITPEELADHQERMEGSYRGIGVETIKMKDTFYVTQLVKNGPADIAGIKVGDAIISVAGDTVSGNNTAFNSLRSKLRTDDISELEVELLSVGEEGPEVKQVSIGEIEIPSAGISYLLDSQTIYVKLERFSGNTYKQFIESLDQFASGGEKQHLVLDLRDNPGGYLPEAIKILSQLFPEKDKLLTFTRGLNRKKAEYRSTGKVFYNIGKVVVLINENSASGSEIMAGAIQDWDRGIIIGRESYGKGLVQEIFPLRNGGALRLTVAKYYTPTGRLIQKSYRSLNRDFLADSSQFQTRLLNRDVTSGTGIVPDVVLEEEIPEACYDMWGYADFYIIHKMHALGRRKLTRQDISLVDYRSFIEDALSQDLPADFDACDRSQGLDYIYSRFIRLTRGETDYYAATNINDPMVIEALNFINDDRTTLAFLSEKN